jgi:hypothetical protein
MEYDMLWVWKTRTLHKGLPQETTIKLGEPTARRRQSRMEWPRFRNRISDPHSNNGAKCNISSPSRAQGNDPRRKEWAHKWARSGGGFYLGLIRSALIRQSSNRNVYISARKSMTVHFYNHSIAKRAEGVALVDSGATENFMNL